MSDFDEAYDLVESVIKDELGADITWCDPGKIANLTVRLSEMILAGQGHHNDA